jgi:hypothetical protein
MNTDFPAFDLPHHLGESATYLLACLVGRMVLSLLVAGPGLLPRRFAPDTRPNAPAGTSNYGF